MRGAIFLLAITAVAAHAAQPREQSRCIDLQLSITKDGQQEQAPRVLAELGQTATVSSGSSIRLSVKLMESGSRADLQFALSKATAGASPVFATPRLLVEYDNASSFQVTAPSGESYRIQVAPRRASCPRGSAA